MTRKRSRITGTSKRRKEPGCYNNEDIKDTTQCDGKGCNYYDDCCKRKKKKDEEDGLLQINEMFIKDSDGNIQHHVAEVVSADCDCNAGDYFPGHEFCDAPCPLRSICVLNAIHFKRIEVSDEQFEQMKDEVKHHYADEYEAHKKKWDKAQYGKGKQGRKKKRKNRKGFIAQAWGGE